MSLDMKILLVEDDPIAQMVYQHYLTQLNYLVDLVEKGKEAVMAITATHAYMGMILDLGLPDMKGEKVLCDIRQYEKENDRFSLPIIITTAHSDKRKLKDCIAKGANAALTKPVSMIDFKEILEKWVVKQV